jgi:hypothetical protein
MVSANPANPANLFAFIDTNSRIVIGLTNSPGFNTAVTNRPSRLFRIVTTLSTNVAGITNSQSLSNHSFIPLSMKIYDVPSVSATISNLSPVTTYETSVFRH